MKDNFLRLWNLQQLDLELKTLTVKLEGIPARIEGLRKTADDLRADLERARQAIIDHRRQYKLAEVDLKSAEEKINGYSVQLYSAKTNEQYKAFLKEIETQKKLKSDIEDRMIVVMEETEALDRKVKQQEHKATELEADTRRKVQLLEAEKQELEAAIITRREQRDTIAKSLPDDVVRRYDRIRANKAGMAVAPVRKERCTGCLSPIPAQRILEIEREDRVYLCESCGRILVVPRD
jgi:hypothetical protein